jgi:phosphohistidine phosphatase
MGDAARALTDEGREEMREHARKVATHVRLEGVLTSPAVRAVQTAEILAEACGVEVVKVRAELSIDRASTRSIEALCREVGPGWALVGHNPSMAEALAHLLGRDSAPPFKKGAVVALKPGASLPWELVWVAAPGRKMKSSVE